MQGELSQLDDAISAIHHRFGRHALARGNELPPPEPWPTGIELVDRLTGLGGLPKGRLSVFQGHGSSGKLSVALALLASATRELAQGIVIDPRHCFDPWALLPFTPNLDALTVARPHDHGGAAEAAIALAKAGAPFLLVHLWDGQGASQNWLGALESAAQRSGAVVLWTADSVPSPLAHASSFTLSLSRSEWLWEHGQLVGLRADVRCVKNKVSAIAGLAGSEVESEVEIRYPIGATLFPTLPMRQVGASEEVAPQASQAEPDAREDEAWTLRSAAV